MGTGSRPRAGTSAPSVTLAIFQLGAQDYAVDIMAVKEIIPRGPVTPVPSAPAGLEGLIDLRGEIIPLVDLATVLGTGAGARARVILCRAEASHFGLIVDGVREVVRVEKARLGAVPTGTPAAFVASFQQGTGVVLVLDPLRAIPEALRAAPSTPAQ